ASAEAIATSAIASTPTSRCKSDRTTETTSGTRIDAVDAAHTAEPAAGSPPACSSAPAASAASAASASSRCIRLPYGGLDRLCSRNADVLLLIRSAHDQDRRRGVVEHGRRDTP